VLILALLALVFLVMFYPFFYVLFLSVMPYENYVRRPVHLWPDGFTPMYFQEIFKERQLAMGFAISLAKTLIGATLAVVVTAMAHHSSATSANFDCVARGMQAVGLQCVARGVPGKGRDCVARSSAGRRHAMRCSVNAGQRPGMRRSG
jgi:hypothetical protein